MTATRLPPDGSYAMARVFNHGDMEAYVPTALSPDPAAPQLAGDRPRKHAACDECRKRKLKCSGQSAGCTRCVKNGLACVYSEQKQMGRPKKKQKVDHDGPATSARRVNTSLAAIDPRLSAADQERTDFQNICTAPLAQAVRRSAPSSSMSSVPPSQPITPASDSHSNKSSSNSSGSNSSGSNKPRTPPDADWYSIQNVAGFSSWPDFSQTALPAPVADAFENGVENTTVAMGRGDAFRPDAISTLPSVPQCACLPNLYLTLSTLATLSAFPPSSHTVSTLASAHRTARDVIYCALCPQKSQTRAPNVMLSTTLLTVLIDQWKRISRSTAAELRAGFCTSPTEAASARPPLVAARQDLEWRTFAYQLMRSFVFGDQPLPLLPDQVPEKAYSYLPSAAVAAAAPLQQISLMALADAMERRQRVWHDMGPDTGEFPPAAPNDALTLYTGLSLEELKELERNSTSGRESGLCCLEMVKHAKRCMRSLERDVPRLA